MNAGFIFSRQIFGERFCITEILVKRLSGAEDKIPVMVSDYLLGISRDYVGEYVKLSGQPMR